MDFAKLATIIPRLRTPIQLTGWLAVVAAGVMTQTVQAANVQAQISLGALGILLLVFGQLFHFINTSIPKKERGTLLLRMFVVFCIFIIGLIAATSYFFIRPSPAEVVLMDSAARIYGTGEEGSRLNSVALSQILDDVAQVDPEPTYAGWVLNRCEHVRRRNPPLVIIHQSAFCEARQDDANCHESERELLDFFRCMQDTRAKFIVYTRYAHGQVVLAAAEEQVPALAARLFLFPMTRPNADGGYTTYDFSDATIGRELQQLVRVILKSAANAT
jgi:hypothetical protein